jgi:glutathione S-transferase
MLEECGLAYRAIPIDISAGDQFKPEFLAISPNNKIPAIVDADGPDGQPISLFESGAILLYLAGKTGKFLGNTDREKYDTLQWLMFQMGGFGPMLGQAHHFRVYAPEKIDYAIDRYTMKQDDYMASSTKNLQALSISLATSTRLPILPCLPGRAPLSIRESTGPISLTQNAGLMSSAPALRFREVCRFSPIYANH